MSIPLHDVTDVQVLGHYQLRLTFSDGLTGDVDLSYLRSRGEIFRPLRDPRYFSKVHVDKEIGTIVWPNGADIAPETLYEKASRHPARGPSSSGHMTWSVADLLRRAVGGPRHPGRI
jgi:hypothetical protein